MAGNLDETSELQVCGTQNGEEKDETRPKFGARYLVDPNKVFQHNAWDNVSWTEEQLTAAESKILENSVVKVENEKRDEYEEEAGRYWNDFYSQHQNRFFKDRHWLFTEFPELSQSSDPSVKTNNCSDAESRGIPLTGEKDIHALDSYSQEKEKLCDSLSQSGLPTLPQANCGVVEGDPAPVDSQTAGGDVNGIEHFPGSGAGRRFLEVGCGVGNTVFPILKANNDPGVFVYCCDFSDIAIKIVKEHPDYDPARCHGFVFDITDQEAKVPFPEGSLDLVILIFVLSAVNPEKMQFAINRLASFLKPGGLILFRDYGRYDLAQLRFKKGRCLSDNFYVRGDGTRVYFFTQDELRDLFTKAGLIEEQNYMDRRLQVNRGRQLTMYRVWIQCKYRKPLR